MASDDEAQRDEIVAMQSIFGGETVQMYPGDNVSGLVKVELDLPDPFYIAQEISEEKGDQITKAKIEYLPPLLLHFTLPKDYPSESKPNFTLSSNWLHRQCLSLLCGKLDNLWDENKGSEILYIWTNYLQTKALSDLGIEDVYVTDWHHHPDKFTWYGFKGTGEENGSITVGEDTDKSEKKPMMESRATSDPIPLVDGKETKLVTFLVSYNQERDNENFRQGIHTCEICYSIKSGKECVRFLCRHAFCEDCAKEYFKQNITEGSVDQVACLAVGCKIKPDPPVILKLVGETLFERYNQILLKRCLENMSDVTYCPRPKCGNPVICDPEWEHYAKCIACDHAFCSVCKKAYHGVNTCKLVGEDMMEIYKKYNEGTEAEKEDILRMYGKKQVQQMMDTVPNEEWIKKECNSCPRCSVPIQKSDGCNKVTCRQCKAYFCWLCLKVLDIWDPYSHFNDPESACYKQLFPIPVQVNDDGDEARGERLMQMMAQMRDEAVQNILQNMLNLRR